MYFHFLTFCQCDSICRKSEEQLPQKTVGQQSANSRPTVGQQSDNSWPTVSQLLADSRPTVIRLSFTVFYENLLPAVGRLLAVCRPTVGRMLVICWPSVGPIPMVTDFACLVD